jgi:hypothetical protein
MREFSYDPGDENEEGAADQPETVTEPTEEIEGAGSLVD